MRASLIPFAVLALLVALTAVVIAEPSPRTARAAAAPPRVLLGAYVNPDESWRGFRDDVAKVESFERMIGRRLDIDMRYYKWRDEIPTDIDRWTLSEGRTALITWQGPALAEILSGREDAHIRARGRALARADGPILLRWGWEMNGDWSAWDGAHNARDPRLYVRAYRRIVRLIRAEGARNVRFVWSPNCESFPAEPWNAAHRYYPGDAYVDWVGIDCYNWGATRPDTRWRSFREMFAPLYRRYEGRKPIMVAETGSAEAGGSKAAWIRDAQTSLRSDFPAVRAIVWFQSRKETDWRVDSSAASLSAFRRLAAALARTPPASR